MRTMKALALLLTASAASADEIPPPQQIFMNGGVICDTQAQVEEQLTRISLQEEDPANGCGILTVPMPAFIEPLSWYEVPEANILIARITFPNGWVQYGWIAMERKGGDKSRSEGAPA